MSSWSSTDSEPASASRAPTTSSGRKLSRIRATSSHRKYAGSGIQSRSSSDTPNEAAMRTATTAAAVHWARTEPLRHALTRARMWSATRTGTRTG
jgi:hypothetical protein